ncbi:MAG: TonB-dependent receptor [Flavobacteriales bacterium]|nr:TonB-dependent receptor [Flavobacteriales bacterium]
MRGILGAIVLLMVATVTTEARAQGTVTISGYVKDASSGEALIAANVYLKEAKRGAVANAYGYYVLNVEPGTHTVVMNYLGFDEFSTVIELKEDLKLNIDAKPKAIAMKEFEAVGERSKSNTEDTQMGTVDLDVQRLNTLPALLGEVDILKTIQFLPGVKSNGEGNSGFYVRGGGPDQNLILLDNATVYNASHLFGFFSVFNADAVKNIELIKGGMPANYGGRISSVLDINMKEGNDKGFHGQGGIGLISSRLTLEGPIVKDRGSFIVSGRRTYIDVLTKPFINDTSSFAGTGYYFYDINAKANYRLSDKDRFFLSGYFGRDVFTFSGANEGDPAFRIPWGNTTVSARWNHVFGPKLFLNTTATFSDYSFAFDATQDQFAFKLFSGIKDYGLKLDMSHYPTARHHLKYGAQYIYHIYTTSTVDVSSGDTEFDIDTPPKLHAHESALYILDDYDVTDLLRVNLGLRLTRFDHVGPYTQYELDERGRSIGTEEFGPGKPISAYTALEPRISARYTLGPNSSVKASFNRGQQYVHLASFSSIALPTDVWIPSSERVKPQIGTQYSAGYFRDLFEDVFEASVEVYYKDFDNLIEYAEGASPQSNGNTNYDAQLVFGDGYSYGAELFIKKRTGKFTGWLGYTWSKTMRQFADINEGREFPSRWDRRNDLSLVLGYDHNKRWSFGATFVYATGQAVTLPVNRYFIEGLLVSEFTDRNGYRMAPYHRLDLSATLTNKEYKTVKDPTTGVETQVLRKWRSSWTFGVYNAYNRRNPYFIYFGSEGVPSNGSFQVVAKQVSLFSVLPSVTWNFKF